MKTLRTIATDLAIPESTLRLYRDEFDELIPCSGIGRRRRYPEEGAEALRKIVEWKRVGWESAQIREELVRERAPRERVRRRTTEERLDEALALLTAQAGEMAMLRAEMGALRATVAELVTAVRADAPPRLEDLFVAEIERR